MSSHLFLIAVQSDPHPTSAIHFIFARSIGETKISGDYDPLGRQFVDLLEARDVSGMTPLHYAAFEGNMEIINLLCDSGADVLAKDQLQQTPLHWAVQGGKHEACALLLKWERGTQALCLSDKMGRTAKLDGMILGLSRFHLDGDIRVFLHVVG